MTNPNAQHTQQHLRHLIAGVDHLVRNDYFGMSVPLWARRKSSTSGIKCDLASVLGIGTFHFAFRLWRRRWVGCIVKKYPTCNLTGTTLGFALSRRCSFALYALLLLFSASLCNSYIAMWASFARIISLTFFSPFLSRSENSLNVIGCTIQHLGFSPVNTSIAHLHFGSSVFCKPPNASTELE